MFDIPCQGNVGWTISIGNTCRLYSLVFFWHFTSKTLVCYEFCWHFWHRSASIVTVLTCNRPEVSGKDEGASDKTKQYTQGVAYRGESPASLSGFFCRQAHRALNSPHSLLSQEVCLTLSLGDDVWADSKSTGLITLAKYSGKYSTLTHMCSINHLYNACHIKCYYDCGLESVSAVLNLARFQECLVALRPPSPLHPPTHHQSIYGGHTCLPVRVWMRVWRVAAVLARSHGPHLHQLGRCQGQIHRVFAVTFPKPSAELRVRVVPLIKQHSAAVRTTLSNDGGIIPSNRPAES